MTRFSLPFGTPVVTAAFLTQALAIGLPMSAYPVFMESLETDLGATRTQTSMGISLIIVAGALIGPFLIPISLGIAFDRLGSYEWAMLAMWVLISIPAFTLGLVRTTPITRGTQ